VLDLRPYARLHTIQMLKQVIRSWWGLELAFSDAKGYVLDHSEGKIIPSQNDFCRAALFSKEGFRRCNESVKAVRDRLKAPSKQHRVFVHECHLGFDVVAAPIHLDDQLVGFLFTGGSYHVPATSAQRQDLLRKVREFAPEAAPKLGEAHGTVPQLSEDDLQRLKDLVEFGAQEVMAYHEEQRRHQAEVGALSAEIEERYRFDNIIGNSPAIQDIFRLLEKICRSESTVLIHGESGTGKELIARAVHYNGPRAKKPFVVQNCSAFNDNLLESALFGHVRGSFTGAVKDKLGLFQVADEGTFFLDEIGDMSPALQVKLLRVLQEGTFTPVGATKPVKVDVRVIAATHKDLSKLVERGEFREDLYYRINVLKITVPPLRDRLEDLPVLIGHFLRKHYHGKGNAPRLAVEALAACQRYRWPGNIRELENEIERLIVLGADQHELPAELLSQRVRDAAAQPAPARASNAAQFRGTLKEAVEALESEYIYQGLIRTHWNKSQLAKELGISRSNLIQKCTYYGLDRKQGE
jgi:transcriptional regulator with PAS, ATPase and Fis domain